MPVNHEGPHGQPHEREIELPLDDLNSADMKPEAAEKVKGGSISPPAPPAGPIPIPYPTSTLAK